MSKRVKANTLQQRLGFMDDDLKKTSHDDIIKWVHDNADHLFEKLIYQKEYSEDEIQYIKEKTTNVLLNTYHKPKDKIIRHNQLGKIPEYSKLTTDDIKFSDQIPKKSKVEVVNSQWEYMIRSEAEKSYTGYKPHAKDIGFVDLRIDLKIPKLGIEGVQIDRKRSRHRTTIGAYFNDGIFVIACPDDSEKELIENQGYLFLKYS